MKKDMLKDKAAWQFEDKAILLQGLLVPEPAVAGLMMASLAAVAMRRRAKRSLSVV